MFSFWHLLQKGFSVFHVTQSVLFLSRTWDFLPIFGICRYFYFWTSAVILMLSSPYTIILQSVTRERKQTSSWQTLRLVKGPFRLFHPHLNQSAYITSLPVWRDTRAEYVLFLLQYFGLDVDQAPLIFVLTTDGTKYVQQHVQPDSLASWLKDCKVMIWTGFYVFLYSVATQTNFTYLLFSKNRGIALFILRIFIMNTGWKVEAILEVTAYSRS